MKSVIAKNQLPRIAIFDSGLGGVSVLKHFVQVYPNIPFIYFADNAHFPYGIKDKKTIIGYAKQVCAFLKKQGVKMIIFACNTLSAVALPTLRKLECDITFIGILEPGAKEVVKSISSTKGRIAVIATETTINSKWYQNYIYKLAPTHQIDTASCGLMVSLVEEGYFSGNIVNAIVKKYLHFVCSQKYDALLLGCTHFSFLKNVIKKIIPPKTKIIDPGEVLVNYVKGYYLDNHKYYETKKSNVDVYVTDNLLKFEKNVSYSLDKETFKIKLVNI